ncbi:MaoC like domain-containing protein [Amycolatopsis pretoriensis]|uniref:MaoC like domain-containing protein n=1 Tax=Amycolatopsis pretoriensis TaxID=218821 RepID=A0A1H5QYN9_9PSEU|nr:MaoC family dehydratase [Amycolatopsis pretoriensis]SEF31256.1 MaoC like domain-containing protein [Amycolatopsis pretoriensis]
MNIGDELPAIEVRVTRDQLVRYAGAAMDFNPIHWNEAFAKEVGLPDVIAHGMLTMALAGRVVTDWLGDPARLIDLSARFTRPVVVPNTPEGAVVAFEGKVGAINEDGTARIDLVAKFDGKTVLGKPQALVRV